MKTDAINANGSGAVSSEAIGRTFTIGVLVALAIMQSILFATIDQEAPRTIGIGLGICAILFAAGLPGRFKLPALWICTAAIAGNFLWHLFGTAEFSHRIFQSGVVLGYGAVLLAVLISLIFRVGIDRTLLLGITVAVPLWAGEAYLEKNTERLWKVGAVRWEGGTVPHPVLQDYYPPYGMARTYYPDNTRHYFEEPNPFARRWILENHDAGSEATLSLPEDAPGRLKITIARAEKPVFWHIQLNERQLPVRRGTTYRISFRARSDSPRKIAYGLNQGHAPWQSLGFYREIKIGQEWGSFAETFALAVSDGNAAVHFDVGANTAGVELENVTVRRVSDNAIIEPPAGKKEYSVTYRFNGLGCRGRDYAIPPPPHTKRIVVVGDSFALGVGVHQQDTVESKLEGLLNAHRRNPEEPNYEVINCGVSGYATTQERLFYELIASRYQADTVLIMMVFNDDRSWRDDVRLGYFQAPDKAESLLYSWHVVELARHHRPEADFTGCVRELRRLDEDCKQHRARLGVVIFRNGPLEGDWLHLRDTVSKGLEGTGIPIIDVGDALLRNHSVEELQVHTILDAHPNQIAHEIAAEQLEQFLHRERYLD